MTSHNNYFLSVLLALVLTFIAKNAFSGTSDHGGNSIVDRILLGRFYAKKVISTSKDPRLTPTHKIKMIELLNGPLNVSRDPVKIVNRRGKEVEVFAKYNTATQEITYNENWIRSANLEVFEVTILSLHEAGHSVGLSTSMAESRADFVDDIGYQLLLESLDAKEDALSQKIFSDAHSSKRGMTCKVGLERHNGSLFEKTIYRGGHDLQKDSVVFSGDLIAGINLHIYYSGNYASINVSHLPTNSRLNTDTAVNSHEGNMFSLRSRQPFANSLSGLSVVCALD